MAITDVDKIAASKRQQASRTNATGMIGMLLVACVCLLSPTGLLGITLPFLVILGFGGLVVCAASLVRLPRWPGILGLVLGAMCIATWSGIGFIGYLRTSGMITAMRVEVAQHSQMQNAAIVLAATAEAQRSATNAAPTSVDLSKLTSLERMDPWGRPYRYLTVPTARGFTFMSDGPDAISNTNDDIDVFNMKNINTIE